MLCCILQYWLTLTQKHYAKGSADRDGLTAAIEAFKKKAPLEIPLVLGGKPVRSSANRSQKTVSDLFV